MPENGLNALKTGLTLIQTMLTTDKILAHKAHGKNLILLTQVESSYFFVVAQVVKSKSLFSRKNAKGTLKAIFQKQVSEAEALAIFNELSGSAASAASSQPLLLADVSATSGGKAHVSDISSDEAVTLLLEGSIQKTETEAPTTKPQPVVSPYFPTKDIFLSVQKTRAPAAI